MKKLKVFLCSIVFVGNLFSASELVRSWDRDSIEEFITSKKDLNTFDEYGNTPLCWAIDSFMDYEDEKYLDLCKKIIDAGADVNLANSEGKIPLLLGTNFSITKLLFQNGADIRSRDADGNTLLHLVEGPGMVKFCLDHGVDASVVNDDGNTPLHSCITDGNVRSVELLVKAGADVNARNENLEVPLHVFLKSSDNASFVPEIINYLVKAGADVNARNQYRLSPLDIAVEDIFDSVVALQALLRCGADVNDKDCWGYAVLHKVENGKFAKLLIDAGADVNARTGTIWGKFYGLGTDYLLEKEETPLHKAAGQHKVDVVRVLLENGADVNIEDGRGQLPLQVALRSVHGNEAVETVKTLLEFNAKVTKEVLDNLYDNIWYCYSDEVKEEIIKLLKEAVAKQQ